MSVDSSTVVRNKNQKAKGKEGMRKKQKLNPNTFDTTTAFLSSVTSSIHLHRPIIIPNLPHIIILILSITIFPPPPRMFKP